MTTPAPSYAQRAIDAVEAELPGLPEGLTRLYALLVLTTGAHTTIEHIHDAWSLWQLETRPDHPAIIPFAELSHEKQELDRPYLEGVHRATMRLWGAVLRQAAGQNTKESGNG